MTTNRLQEIRILASRLAKHYSSDKKDSPCACTGLDCGNPDCVLWWEQFLELFRAEDITKMVSAYIIATGYPQLSNLAPNVIRAKAQAPLR